MIRRSTLIAVEILLGLVAALAIGVGVAWWRFSQGPIELNSMRDQIETALSEARSGRPVGIERVELAWSARNALELRAIGVTVEDGRGGVLSRSDEARISLNVLPLLIGRISVSRAEFVGGAMTFTRRLDGAMLIAFGPEGAPPDIIIRHRTAMRIWKSASRACSTVWKMRSNRSARAEACARFRCAAPS